MVQQAAAGSSVRDATHRRQRDEGHTYAEDDMAKINPDRVAVEQPAAEE